MTRSLMLKSFTAICVLSSSCEVLAQGARGLPSGPYVEMRWVERSGQTVVPAGALPGTLNTDDPMDATVWLVLEARLVTNGQAGFYGFPGIDGSIWTDDLQTDGDWKTLPSGRNASPATMLSAPSHDNPQFQPFHRGAFAPYRLITELGEQAQGTFDAPEFGGYAGLQAVPMIAGGAYLQPFVDGILPWTYLGLESWVPMLTVQYDFIDLSPRTVTFRFSSLNGTFTPTGTAMTGWDANLIPTVIGVPVVQTPYSIQIVPAPGGLLLLLGAGVFGYRRRR